MVWIPFFISCPYCSHGAFNFVLSRSLVSDFYSALDSCESNGFSNRFAALGLISRSVVLASCVRLYVVNDVLNRAIFYVRISLFLSAECILTRLRQLCSHAHRFCIRKTTLQSASPVLQSVLILSAPLKPTRTYLTLTTRQ